MKPAVFKLDTAGLLLFSCFWSIAIKNHMSKPEMLCDIRILLVIYL